MIPAFSRPTRALVSRGALLHNFSLMKKTVGPACSVQAVLKADAYGHGAAAIAPLLARAGATSFGVATLEEAVQLRKAGIRREIILLGALEGSSLEEAARWKIGVTAWNRPYLEAASRRLRRPLDIHLKVDTGMARLGFGALDVAGVLADFQGGRWPRLRLASAYTHLACADEPLDRASARQLKVFRGLPWPEGLALHAANSAAALRLPEARFSRVRSGIFIYGAMAEGLHPMSRRQRPVMAFHSRVLRVASLKTGEGVSYGHTFRAKKPMKVATLCVGYADGVPRALSNRGEVLIHGTRCRILGRVCMDLMMADVTRIKGVKPGDLAVLLGQQGKESVEAHEWARLCGTNTYEILCGITGRVPRELVA